MADMADTGYGMVVAYVFATAFHTGLLGAMATLTKSAWYPTYAARAPAWLGEAERRVAYSRAEAITGDSGQRGIRAPSKWIPS